MKRFAVVLITAAIVSFVSTVSSYAAEPTADDYIAFFRPIFGEFDAKAKVGDQQTETQLRCRLLANKKCCITSLGEVPPYPAFTSIDGYDASTRKWKITGFDTAGDHWVTYLGADAETLKNRQGGALQASARQTKPDGTIIEWKSKWTYTFAGDKITCSITDQTRNNEKTPDEEYVYTRKKALDGADFSPAMLKYFPGKWEAKDANGAVVGSVDWKLAAGGKTFTGSGTFQGAESFSLAGWDLHDKRWIHSWFDGNGTYGRIVIDSFANNAYTGRVRVVDKDGKAATGPWTLKVLDANQFEVAEVLEGKTNVLRFDRVKQ